MQDIVKRIVDEWDPIGLLPYAPKDEYKDEAELVSAELWEEDGSMINAEKLAVRIREIFIRQFGDLAFEADVEECSRIAQVILSEVRNASSSRQVQDNHK